MHETITQPVTGIAGSANEVLGGAVIHRDPAREQGIDVAREVLDPPGLPTAPATFRGLGRRDQVYLETLRRLALLRWQVDYSCRNMPVTLAKLGPGVLVLNLHCQLYAPG